MRRVACCLFLVLFLTACAAPNSASQVASAKSIKNIGSDTIVNLALAWAEAYQTEHPGIRISVSGGGSGTGIAALINGTTDLANASRQIKSEEVANAKANKITPVEHIIARDAIAVIVHRANPVKQLSLQQISDIYTGKITNWQQVSGENRPIVLLSRETNSGTHVFFLEQVIRLGNSKSKALFAPETLLLPSSEGITTEIRQNPNAIGYDGLGYVTADTQVVAVARDPKGPFILPSIESVTNKTYPIARELYMYTAGNPTDEIQKYLEWITSPAGQTIVAELGFVPLSAKAARDQQTPPEITSTAKTHRLPAGAASAKVRVVADK